MPVGTFSRRMGVIHPMSTNGTMHAITYPKSVIGPPRMAASGTAKMIHAPAPLAKNESVSESTPCVLRATMYVSLS